MTAPRSPPPPSSSAVVLVAILAPEIAALTGHGPTQQFLDVGLSPAGIPVGPSRTFLLGTDGLGRDVLVRIAYGTRVSLLVGVLASGIAVVVGAVVGIAAGWYGGLVDRDPLARDGRVPGAAVPRLRARARGGRGAEPHRSASR